MQKIVSRIGVLSRQSPRPLIGICGCVAQQEGEALLERSDAVAFVVGPGEVGSLAEALRAVAEGQRPVRTAFERPSNDHVDVAVRRHATRGMVTVVEGCNEFCTFCIVPYTRGRERSRPVADVVAEVRSLAASGLREVELLGQTINAYRCPATGADFADLLNEVARISELARVRFVTSHPRHFHPKLVDTMAAHPKVSRYLHLPFQAGSDRILKAMHRRYTRDEYLDLVENLRAAIPEINLSTDVIVGFPGEEGGDFAETLEVLEEVRFGQVFAFLFSPRPGTPAARYTLRVPDDVAKARLQRLFEVSDRITLELNHQLIGRRIRVLVDGESRRDSELSWQGRGEDNRVVNFAKTGTEGVGDIVEVRITAASAHSLQGTRVDAPACLPVVSGGRGAA
jgi:tRNA-2-methylthio-N6-dimethylallyladenosine synthase